MYKNIVIEYINVYSLHTNFDVSLEGMNMLMAKELNLKNLNFINKEKLVIVGNFDITISLKKSFNVSNIQFIGNKINNVTTIALAAGAGGDIVENISSNIDIVITGEMKWNHVIEANDKNINVILIGHYMEQKFTDFLANFLINKLLSKVQVLKYSFENPITFFLK